MKFAICAKTRCCVPESPDCSRLPSAASASSMTTPTGVSEARILRMRSRFPSVEPTHIERKFLSFTHGKPISREKHSTRKVLALPTGPQIR